MYSDHENYNMEQRLEWNYRGREAFTRRVEAHYSGLEEGEKNLVPKNNDNTLGCERAGIIAVHYVCSIYTTSHSPTAADG